MPGDQSSNCAASSPFSWQPSPPSLPSSPRSSAAWFKHGNTILSSMQPQNFTTISHGLRFLTFPRLLFSIGRPRIILPERIDHPRVRRPVRQCLTFSLSPAMATLTETKHGYLLGTSPPPTQVRLTSQLRQWIGPLATATAFLDLLAFACHTSCPSCPSCLGTPRHSGLINTSARTRV